MGLRAEPTGGRTGGQVLFVLICLWSGFALALPTAENVQVVTGWQFRYSPPSFFPDSSGSPALADGEGWKDLATYPSRRLFSCGPVTWFRVQLPDTTWEDPALLVENLAGPVEAFVEGVTLYRFGWTDSGSLGPYPGSRWHLVPLPRESAGQWVYLRSASCEPLVPQDLVTWIGSRGDLQLELFSERLDGGIFGTMAVVVGLIALAIVLRRREQWAYLYLGVFALCSGLIQISSASLTLLISDAPFFWSTVRNLSRGLAMPAVLAFTLEACELRNKRQLQAFTGLLALGALIVLAFDLATGVRFPAVRIRYLNAEFFVCALASILYAASQARRAPRTLGPYLAGLMVWLGLSIHEGLVVSRVLHGGQYTSWGTMLLLLTMGNIMLKRFAGVFEALQAELRRRDEFLSIASHELRNPLAVVAADAQLLGAAVRDAAIRPYVEGIQEQVVHLTRLVEDMLDASRISHGKLALRCEPLNAVVAVEHCLKGAKLAAEQKQIQLEFAPTAQVAWTLADPTRLDQIVGNIVRNAIKYTGRGGRVRVGVDTRDGWVVIRVKDTGAGMSPGTIARIFKMYEQGTGSFELGQEGMGVGLALVRTLVEMHHGSVRATSDGRGLGSEFVVELPACEPPRRAPASPAEPVPPSPATAASGRAILLIDDNVNLRTSTRMLLENCGFVVSEASDGREGLQKLFAGRFDGAVVDLQMPELDGLEVARRIRASQLGSSLKLVALTGFGLPQDRARAQEAGFDHVITKPADPEKLAQLLNS